jgi:hypothetical protein
VRKIQEARRHVCEDTENTALGFIDELLHHTGADVLLRNNASAVARDPRVEKFWKDPGAIQVMRRYANAARKELDRRTMKELLRGSTSSTGSLWDEEGGGGESSAVGRSRQIFPLKLAPSRLECCQSVGACASVRLGVFGDVLRLRNRETRFQHMLMHVIPISSQDKLARESDLNSSNNNKVNNPHNSSTISSDLSDGNPGNLSNDSNNMKKSYNNMKKSYNNTELETLDKYEARKLFANMSKLKHPYLCKLLIWGECVCVFVCVCVQQCV